MEASSSKFAESVRIILLCLGGLLIFFGGSLLLVFSYIAYQIAVEPQSVDVVQYMLALSDHAGPVIDGKMVIPGQQPGLNPSFEVNFSSFVKSVTLIFLGIIIFGVLINLLNILISGGVKIIQACGCFGTGPEKKT